MSLPVIIKLAVGNIVSNKLRSALTMLGLVIGVASVITLVGIGQGTVSSVAGQVASLGADVITINIGDSQSALEYDEATELSDVEGVASITPYQMLSATISSGGDSSSWANVVGTGDSFIDMMGYTVESGRNISRIDVENCTKAAVIGSSVAEEFWGSGQAVGDTLKVEGDSYTVIGVLESAGSSMGNNVDDTIIIPITTAKYLGSEDAITSLYAKSDDEETADAAVTNLENYFAGQLGISSDDVSISTQEMMLEAMEDITNTLSLLLGGIAGISLLVGGIGVMNIMLVSVAERTREIGIRKSLGARKKDILKQFMAESMVLSFLGGIIGVLAGYAGGSAAEWFDIPFAPGIGVVVLAVGVSITVGMVFGIFPSYRAACLKPVEALRYE